MAEPIHIISLGAGVQSSTMALMAAAGEMKSPKSFGGRFNSSATHLAGRAEGIEKFENGVIEAYRYELVRRLIELANEQEAA